MSDRRDPADSAALRALASRFLAARTQRGLSQESLAGLSGVHRVTIARLEAGDLDPRYTTLRKLQAALQVSVSEDT